MNRVLQLVWSASLITAIVFSCVNNTQFALLASNKWFDENGHLYEFTKDGTKYSHILYRDFWWDLDIDLNGNDILSVAVENGVVQECVYILEVSECKILIKHVLHKCNHRKQHSALKKEKALWRHASCLIDESEELVNLTIVNEGRNLYFGIKRLAVDSSRRVTITLEDQYDNYRDSAFTLSSQIYKDIEYVVQLLPLEQYADDYDCQSVGSNMFSYTLTTSSAQITGNSKQCVPPGIWTIFEYIGETIKQ